MRIKADGYEITNEGDTGHFRVGVELFGMLTNWNIYYNFKMMLCAYFYNKQISNLNVLLKLVIAYDLYHSLVNN